MSQLRDDGPFLSIVIPCYNEEKNLERGVLQEVHEYLVTRDYVWEVIVANDESTDSSRRLIKRFTEGKPRFSLVDIPHGGKPAAVWAGIREARGEIVLFTDMDQSTPLEEVEKLLPWYDQGCDVVIGSRGTEREGFSIVRRLGSAVFRTLRRLFLLRGLSDTQCGFKSCKREAALEVFPQLQFFKQKDKPVGWKVSAYDVELLHLFEKAGYQLKEVEVAWLNRDESVTKDETGALARYMRESLEMTREVLRVRVNELKGLYDV